MFIIIKTAIKKMLPNSLLIIIHNILQQIESSKPKYISTRKVFENIYETGAWGISRNPLQPFYSGSGSHDIEIVLPYLKAVEDFLRAFERKPNVVDLGCGDFSIGSRVRHLCNEYIACDIVSPLIEFNKEKFAELGVDFRVLDLTKDELPSADIVFIRQVFQHLSNKQILNALPQLCSKYRYVVFTDHLPATRDFQHNLDIPPGPHSRLQFNSGVVLTSAPFNIKPTNQKRICEVPELDGLIVTKIYEFR
jgi:hypothetical protein